MCELKLGSTGRTMKKLILRLSLLFVVHALLLPLGP